MDTVAGTAVDTTVLTVLGTAFGVMFATITTLMIASIRFQHRDSIQIRDRIERSSNKNRKLIEGSNKMLRDEIEGSNKMLRDEMERLEVRLTDKLEEHSRATERNHDKVVTSLDDVRDRLARVEGHLGIGIPAQSDPDPESNDDNSEAA